MKEAPIVISVGGSLIVPNGDVDTQFLSQLNTFIRKHVAQGKRFILVAGGGSIARIYRDAGKNIIGRVTNDDLDWLAIHLTRVNAHLLRTIFQDIAHPRIIQYYNRKFDAWKEPIIIGAGWKPGWSTDYCAVMAAQHYKANLIINLSNINWVYDRDPKKYRDAKIIKKITWEEFEHLVGKKWTPGLNVPFDPIATQRSKKLGLTVVVTNGSDFANTEKILNGEEFRGTIIMPYRIDASFYDRDYYTGKKGEHKIATVESRFGRWFHGLANLYRALLIKLFLNPKTCLDVGCGTGGLVKALRRLGIEAYGVELSAIAISLANKTIQPYLKQGNISRLPYHDNQFDLVLTFDVMEHLERSKIRQALNETFRVTRRFIYHKIYTTENSWINLLHGRDFSHLSVLSQTYWKKLFMEHPGVVLQRKGFFKLPSFFESVFVLRKK
ncbi:UMP kinase [Patescibacteria group bacterium]|nr:UMP kinase [Patescibacteria group bacterium]MCL5091402.1 UMP kinase [Patescibacteria group bacterium]